MKHLLKEGEISRLFSDKGGGDTGEAHLIKHNGDKYALRIAPNLKTARAYVQIYKGLEKYNIFPKLLYHHKKHIIFEYIEGRDLTQKDISPKIAYSIGKITACISNLNYPKSSTYNLNTNFFKKLKKLLYKGIISKENYILINEIYNTLNKKLKVRPAWDITDPTPDNFRLDKKTGNVYFIDIEAIKPGPKGIGISKAFLRWFKTEKQRKYFIKGYSSISNARYITKDYLQFIYLHHIISNIYSRVKDKKDPSERISMLNDLLAGNLK